MSEELREEKTKTSHRKYSRRFFLFTLLLFLTAASVFTNADLDSEQVAIDNVTAYMLDSSVIIYWDTNIIADSLVRYGITPENLSESNYLGVHSYSHAAEIIGLLPNTQYYYFVNSTNANGNSNQTQIFNFTTLEDNASPVYSNVSIYPNASVIYSEGGNYSIRATWKDNGLIANVSIVHNFISGIQNETVNQTMNQTGNESELNETNSTNTTNATNSTNTTNTSQNIVLNAEEQMIIIPGTDIYEYSLSGIPAGIYTWRLAAYDIVGNYNSTENYTLEIGKAAPSLNISINGLQQNTDIEQKSFVNITGLLEKGDSGIELIVRNASAVLNRSFGSEETVLLHYFEAPGIYEIVLVYNETVNYVSHNISYTINVTPIEVNIFIDKPEYNLGETVSYVVLAPNESNLSVEICGPLPTGAGFVECRTLLNAQQSNYPYMNVASITNKSGTYKIRAQIQYKGLNKYSEKNYTVVNSIQITVSGDTLLKVGKESNLVASATGGIGLIRYNWTLPNGTKISGPNLNVKYNSANTYPVIITAVDEQGNTRINTSTLTVKKFYTVKFLVLDNADSQVLDSAKVKVTSSSGESDIDNVNIDGYAEFDLFEGEYDVRVSSSGYSSYVETINADSNKTITVKLSKSTSASSGNEPLEINMVLPSNDAVLSSSSVNFEGYVDLGGNTLATCIFYVAESNDGWYRAVKTVSVTSSGKISASDSVAKGKTYTWKVQCTVGTKTYSSDVWKFTASGTGDENDNSVALLEDGYNQVIDAGEIRRRIDTAMTNYDAMDVESKKDAEALQFSASADKALRDYERAMRDINNIQYRRDLSESEQEAKKIEYYAILKDVEKKAFLDVKTLSHETFISYPSKEDLISTAELYKKENNIIGSVLEDDFISKQNGIIVTTRISNVEVTFIDGNKKTIAMVVKTIKISDNSSNTFLLESIPKEFAESSDDIILLSEAKVVLKDPLLKFEKIEKIVYYVEGERNLEIGKKINTILLADTFFGSRNAITGNVTLSDIDFTSPVSLIILIALISCGYLIYAFDIFGMLFEKSRKKDDEQKINKILSLIRDAQMLIESRKISQADLTFKEIKLIYEGSSDTVMAEVYKEVMNLLEVINSAQTELLLLAAGGKVDDIPSGEMERLADARKMLTVAYNLLSDSLKQKYGDKIGLMINNSNADNSNNEGGTISN